MNNETTEQAIERGLIIGTYQVNRGESNKSQMEMVRSKQVLMHDAAGNLNAYIIH